MAAIVPAAGYGARTGLNQNKILSPVCGQPILHWTLAVLMAAAPILQKSGIELRQILVAARLEDFPSLHSLIAPFSALVKLVEGGATRQQSVDNAAQKADADFLLMHDAARPLASVDLIARVAESALKNGAAIAALPATDTIKIARLRQGVPFVGSTPERAQVWHAQTPQVFRRALFLRALENAARTGLDGTDCASLVEQIGEPVALVAGEIENFKVTFADDLRRAESIFKVRSTTFENAVN